MVNRILGASIVLGVLAACSHPLEIQGQGDIISASGDRTCVLEDFWAEADVCAKNYAIDAYQETYTPQPRSGWQFERWENYCADAEAPDFACTFNVEADIVGYAWGETAPALRAVFSPIPATPFSVDAQDTDPAIASGAPHFVFPPQSEHNGKLFVFFPGTGATPAVYTMLAERAADLGYAVINLSYVNSIAVNFICAFSGPGSNDPDCHEKVRAEILTGADESPFVSVDVSNSIENRLLALINYLQVNDNAIDWGQFLVEGAIDWSTIATGGHSQGGGHAAFIGKRYLLDRALLFSSTEPADWTEPPGVTPSQRYFAFAHENEQLQRGIRNSWPNLGIPGPEENVDGGLPGSSSQRFLTARALCNGSDSGSAYHQCTSSDNFTPRDALGDPTFGPIWDFMLQHQAP